MRVFLQGDNANPHNIELARRKAYTARTFRQASSAWAKRTETVNQGQRMLADVIPLGGGMPINIGDEDLSRLTNWFECLRSHNTKTNATVDNGYLHSVATIMAAQSYWQGKRLYYDAAAEQIKDSAPASSSAG